MVVAKLKLKLKKYSQKEDSRKKFEVSGLRNKDVRDDFSISLRNRYEALDGLLEDDVDGHWNQVQSIYISLCDEKLGPRRYEHKAWISQETLVKIKERKKMKAMLNDSRSRADKADARERYSTIHKEVKKLLKDDKRKYVEDLAESAEKAAAQGNMKEVYETTKKLTGKFGRAELPVKDATGNSIPGQDAQKTRWEEHFSNLLNRPPPVNPPDIAPADNDLDINCEPPLEEEIISALKLLKSGKAAGGDCIPAEALKADVKTTGKILHSLFDKIWNRERSPKDWKEGHLIKLPKKGDLSNCNNYRGIMLLSVPGKVLSRIILERMKDMVDVSLRGEQAGFRRGRSCADQIATLRMIIEQSLEWNSSLYINFVDYEKAFDSVDRETLWKLLRHYGVPQKIVDIIKESYEGFTCRVVHDGQLTNSFNVNTGVRQGCLLSPFLFLLAIDYIMRTTTLGRTNGIQWTFNSQLDDLDFADDIALLSHSRQQMQDKTAAMTMVSENIGLRIHPGKTKTIRVKSTSQIPIQVNEKPLEEVDSFTYLGSIIDKKGGVTADIRARIGKARQSFATLKPVLRADKLTNRTKLRLFNSNVKSVLLYGCETWCLTQTNGKKIQTFVNGCLRYILKVHYPKRIRNEILWKKTKQEPIEDEIRKRKWRWIGHTLRKPPETIARQALQWTPQGCRKRGRPAQTWKRDLEKEMSSAGLTWTKMSKKAEDRFKWKEIVRGLCPGAEVPAGARRRE